MSISESDQHWVAVLGAGVMGADLALDLAAHDYRVILKDLSEHQLTQARERIRQRYRFIRLMKREVMPMSCDELFSRIVFTTDFEGLDRVEVLIENITEDVAVKEQLYRELSPICPAGALVGINSSCISISQLASLMPRPERIVGMHFFNPVPLKPVVEVVRGEKTSAATLEEARRFLKTLGKTCVVVRDVPGYATNRVLMVMINECIWLVHDRVAEAADIDTIFRLGIAHKMGPLATADLIGLDTILRSLKVLYDGYQDAKYRPCPLLEKMVAAGSLGQKSGQGFFHYGT